MLDGAETEDASLQSKLGWAVLAKSTSEMQGPKWENYCQEKVLDRGRPQGHETKCHMLPSWIPDQMATKAEKDRGTEGDGTGDRRGAGTQTADWMILV